MVAEEPISRIETLVIVRPLKAVALVLAALALLLMSLSLAATSWLEANSAFEGLWEKCHYHDHDPDRVNCDFTRSRGWLHACRGLCIMANGSLSYWHHRHFRWASQRERAAEASLLHGRHGHLVRFCGNRADVASSVSHQVPRRDFGAS
ncbi:uncharacterized protein LOC112556321 [Pomacea canaliculata]|uniref:uncharacterized protein LOC112556321 n=1 Tax=Pomacea canaliculata TaxID=400727 RepID=UPI000D73BB47|nr:uncharacterized protein LOC112556321 [Pomacea canaliculata]XP_025080984.1 uncharacterized protein LOC112556321 [Pomacea canaliculata]XP_025080985.1 uncharacterized protein LOC112556321 [Pomacea canaliculata]